ncbi:MAG: hypothetical protein ACTSUW_03780 [Candidatus Heimdallarchaeota archaeon]
MLNKEKEYSEWEYEEKDKEDEEEELDDYSSEEDEDQESEESEKNLDDDEEVEIELGDKKEKVTLSELKKGYMRQSDYTRKTQELSKKDEQKVMDKSKEVIENKDDYPEDDVKAAEYFIKIAKDKFGLLTKDEYEAEKMKEKQINELDDSFKNLSSEVKKMKGMPKIDEDDLIDYMKKTGIHNPKAAYLSKYDTEYRDYIIKKSKGNSSYSTDKKGKIPDNNEKKVDVSTDEGHRSYLKDILHKMQK